jgi:hypothetical protein
MKTARVLVPCTFLLIGACHRDSGTPPPQAAPTPHIHVPVMKKGPTAAELTAGMVEAAGQGKSDLPVQLKFELQQMPTVGQPLDINVAVLPQIDANPADLQVTGGEGLTVAAAAAHIDLAAVESGQVYRHSFTVTPGTEGVLLLGVTVSLKHDDAIDTRAFSIPLIVQRSNSR